MKPTTREICDAIGRAALANELGVRTTAVSNAVVTNAFPASWFKVIERMTARAGVKCPHDLFTWKGNHSTTPDTAPDAEARNAR